MNASDRLSREGAAEQQGRSLEALERAARLAELRSAKRTRTVVVLVASGALLLMAMWSLAAYQQWREAEASAQLAMRAREEAVRRADEIEELYKRATQVRGIRATSRNRDKYVSDAGYLVDATNNKPIAKLGDGPIYLATFSPDSTLLAVVSDNGMFLYDSSGALILSINDVPTNVLFSPDSQNIVVVRRNGAVSILDRIGRTLRSLETARGVNTAAISPDGKRLLTQSAAAGELQIWDFQTGRLLTRFRGGPRDEVPGFLGFSADGAKIAAKYTGGQMSIWNAQTGVEESVFTLFTE